MSFVLLLSLFVFLFDLILHWWRIGSSPAAADDLPDVTSILLSAEPDLIDDDSDLSVDDSAPAMEVVLALATELAAPSSHVLISLQLQTGSGLVLAIGLSRDGMLFASLSSGFHLVSFSCLTA